MGQKVKKMGDINYGRPLMVRKSKETFTYFRTESLISLRGKYIEVSKINILQNIVLSIIKKIVSGSLFSFLKIPT